MTDTSDEALAALCKTARRKYVDASEVPVEKTMVDIADHQGTARHDCMAIGFMQCFTEVAGTLPKMADAIDALRTERDAALARAETAEARVERLRDAALPFARSRTMVAYDDVHGRTWRCQVTADDLAELRNAIKDTAPA